MSDVLSKPLPGDPLEALATLAAGEAELERLRREQVAAARSAGASWQQIGEALGITRQSAWESFAAEARAVVEQADERANSLSEEDAMSLAVDEVRAVRRQRDRS